MCCRRRRAARQAWLEQRAAGGGKCGRSRGWGTGPGPDGPSSRPPFTGGRRAFRRWQDAPREDAHQESLHYQQATTPRNDPTTKDIEKATPAVEPKASRVPFTFGPLGWRRNSMGTDADRALKRESTMSLPPRYKFGVPEVPQRSDDGAVAKRESLPPDYTASTKY
ncbi:hypothetical protein CGRA01v4_14686 [Colletotrichum graminicola]|uniref:Uncharacterized protein n=1 Tax=Colletotrichum graminicola (strain M1.001 / M2 / FGSC 10212) TaxID=645133 RepID=E3QF25_COLGM|nr:uncharacterized protein GLRG_04607 [Colletotrichum graminicola M1.001]EFQ29463.1 hypothetical protein GLRG_04607 [Colletotrichum graminicola M1.001]WDK23394.1 hypothetical protein CGRA01v4_14686 [Colletotrichum graminicola]